MPASPSGWRSSSRQTFFLLPALVVASELLRRRGRLRVDAVHLGVMAAGYLQYRMGGAYRLERGGGGPGMDTPPERLVTSGPYAYSRNPMYGGHLVFMAGLALCLRSPLAALLAIERWYRFSRRVQRDEARLRALFGGAYAEYASSVRRWG